MRTLQPLPNSPSFFRLPAWFDADWVMGFLAMRALPPIETCQLEAGVWRYRRSSSRYVVGVDVRASSAKTARLVLSGEPPADVAARLRRLLSIDVPHPDLVGLLGNDPDLGTVVRARPGLSVPGAWDGFELAVRAILGQQVSVERARRLGLALIERFGDGGFPGPAELVDADVSAIGMPGKRGGAVRALAELALAGGLDFAGRDREELCQGLLALPGIGPWTVAYVRLRAGRDMDAFPHSDWVVCRELNLTAAKALRRAEAWRGVRGYALMYLWHRAALRRGATAETARGSVKEATRENREDKS